MVVWMSEPLLADYKNALLDLDRGLWATKNKPKNNEPFVKVRIIIEQLPNIR